VAENLVRQELLYQEARKTVRVTDAEVTAELEKLKSRFQTEADFAEAAPSLRPQVEKRLMIAKYIEAAYTAKAQVTDDELRSSYERNRQALRQPEQVKTLYIFVKVDPAWGEARKKEAKKKIEDIRKKALKGEDFASLARTYSEDPTAPRGGDLGYIRPGQLMVPLEKALFALKTGEVSATLEAGAGYHLFKAMDHKAERTMAFEEVKDKLRTLLKQEKGQQAANASIGKVREKAKVEISLPREE
jgi:parvulin-like peptidyl-prolyl isomerase